MDDEPLKPVGWMAGLPLSDQRAFIALMLEVHSLSEALKTTGSVGMLELAVADEMDAKSMGSMFRASAGGSLQQAKLLLELAGRYESLAALTDRA